MTHQQKKILVIDDSSVNNLLLQYILEEENYQVMVAFSGKEGLEMAKSEKPDLMIQILTLWTNSFFMDKFFLYGQILSFFVHAIMFSPDYFNFFKAFSIRSNASVNLASLAAYDIRI